jgi:hypothetical protein
MAVTLHLIVEHLNKIKYLALSFFRGCVDFSLNNPLLKCSKEAFSNVEANELAVYFSAERQCSPHIILFDYQSLEAEDVAEWDQVTGERFDSMIGLNVASVAHSSDNSPAFLVFDYYRLDEPCAHPCAATPAKTSK